MIAEGLIAHLVGDYVLQSDWMAKEKTKRWIPAVLHGLAYTLPFLALTRSPLALLVIAGTHMVLDHYRIAKHVIWLKEHMAPRGSWTPFSTAMTNGGFAPTKEAGYAVALLILVDNTMHIVINSAALTWWG